MNDSIVPPGNGAAGLAAATGAKAGVTRIWIADIRSPRIRRLHEYWDMQRARHSGSCVAPPAIGPRRADILPDDIRDLLAHLMIVDVERHPAPDHSTSAETSGETLRFRYRLVGTQVVAYNGVEFTGKYLGEIGWRGEADLLRSYHEVVAARSPVFGAISWELHEGDEGQAEFGRFPLSEDGIVVTQVLVIEDYDFTAADAAPAR